MSEPANHVNDRPKSRYLAHSLRWHISHPLTLYVLELAGMYAEERITYLTLIEKVELAHLGALERARQVTESSEGWLLSVMEYEFEKIEEEVPRRRQENHRSLFSWICDIFK